MAARRKLKVFRTAIGFHDAYVAAPSQKAALAAWGSERNLFAIGAAEQVTDTELTREPLAHPGQVFTRRRGSAGDNLEMLSGGGQGGPRRASAPRRAAKPPPRPSRAAIEQAEELLAAATAAREDKLRRITRKEEALRRERKALERTCGEEIERLARARDEAGRDYDRAVDAWRKGTRDD